jgi:hypothetical protein
MEHRSPGGGDMTRSMKLLWAIPLALLSLALASPAFADETCDPLDVTCVVTGTTDSGQQTVDNTTDTVTGTAKPIADDPLGTVGRILHPGSPGGGAGGGGGGGAGDQPNGGGTADRPVATGSHPAHGAQVGRPAGSRPSGPRSAGSSLDPSTIPVPLSKDPVFADQFAGAVRVVAPSLGVVLALFAVALGFVMVQDRLDGRDPKLSLAPVQTEMMGFS